MYQKPGVKKSGYGYVQSYGAAHSFPPAKRQAVERKRHVPRRVLPKIPKAGGSEILTPFGGMPRSGTREHFTSLRLEHVQRTIRPLLGKFLQHTSNRGNFNEPVDTARNACGISLRDYHEKVKIPLDFGTIKTRLQGLEYNTADDFATDMRLVFSNAMLFYPPLHELHEAAATMSADFETEYDKLVKKQERGNVKKGEHACSLCQGETCALCGAKCLKCEPPAIVCDGPCAQRLRRGATYYITHGGDRVWCQRCHGGLHSVLPPPDGTDGMAEYMDPEERESVEAGLKPPSLLYKRDLLRRKFDEEIAEPWVQCDSCQRWVHQTCALFNERNNATEQGLDARFCCPECEANTKVPPMKINIRVCGESKSVLDNRPRNEEEDVPPPALKQLKLEPVAEEAAMAPPDVSMREGCADGMEAAVGDAGNVGEKAAEGAVVPEGVKTEGVKVEGTCERADAASSTSNKNGPEAKEATADMNKHWWSAEKLPQTHLSRFVEAKCNQRMAELLKLKPESDKDTDFAFLKDKRVIVRVVSCLENTCEVNYAVRKYFHSPRHLPYRSKALMMFQKVDGVDMCLWTMYVQEYGKECPEPSKRRVYIAYLDSVEYFRPRHVRTHIYHEILVSYLGWVSARGFTHAHIWACPPYRGNNFVFWCHPAHQRTPSSERLIQWYRTMLERGKAVGVVSTVDNLYAYSFKRFHMDTKDLKPKMDKHPEWDPLEETAPLNSCPPIFDGDMWMDEACVANRRIVARKEVLAEGGNSPHDGCLSIIKKLMKHPSSYPFNTPVDAMALKIPQYYKVVKHPMDLGTAKRKLLNHEYSQLRHFAYDVRLTFENAKAFNPPKHPVHTMATSLCNLFDKEARFLLSKWQHLIQKGCENMSLKLLTKDELEGKERVVSRDNASECSSAPGASDADVKKESGSCVEPSVAESSATRGGGHSMSSAASDENMNMTMESMMEMESRPPRPPLSPQRHQERREHSQQQQNSHRDLMHAEVEHSKPAAAAADPAVANVQPKTEVCAGDRAPAPKASQLDEEQAMRQLMNDSVMHSPAALAAGVPSAGNLVAMPMPPSATLGSAPPRMTDAELPAPAPNPTTSSPRSALLREAPAVPAPEPKPPKEADMPLTSGSDASLVAVHKTTDASIATGNQTTAMGQQPYVQTNAAAQGTASKPPLINSQGMCPPGAPTAMAIPPRMPPLVGANNATAAIPPPHPSSSLLAGSSTAAAAAASMRGTPLSVAVPPLQNSSAAAAGLPASPSTGQPSLHSLGVGSPRPPAAPVGVGSPCPPVAPVGMGSPCPPGHSAAQRFGSQAQPYVLSPPNTGARAAPLQQQPPPPSASGGASAGTFSTLSQPQQAAMGASVAQPVRTPVRPPPGGQPHAGYVPVPYSPRGSKGDPARDAKEGDEVIPVWTLPPPRRLDWEVVGMENSKVQLRCRPKPKSVQPLHGMGLEGPLPPPRKPPSIATEFKIPLPAQVARTIEKMKNDFFVVNLCSAGSNLTPSQDTTPWNAEEVGIGPAAAAGRRRGAPTAANVLKQENEAAAGRHHEAAAPSTDGAGGTVQKGGRANVPHSPSKLARMEAASHGGATEVKSEDVKTEVKPFSEAAAAAPEVKLEAGAEQRVDAPAAAGAPQLASPPQALGKRSRSDMEDAEKDGMVTRSETAPLGIDVNPILSRYLGSAPLPAVELMEDTADPDPLQSAPFVDSRHTFLEMCQWRHYQFDTLRRAKHASLMTLHHLHNTTVHDNKEHAPHCAVCGQQIKGVRWHCPVCPDFELCSTCNTHDPNSASLHPHLLTPYRVSYEGALRA